MLDSLDHPDREVILVQLEVLDPLAFRGSLDSEEIQAKQAHPEILATLEHQDSQV